MVQEVPVLKSDDTCQTLLQFFLYDIIAKNICQCNESSGAGQKRSPPHCARIGCPSIRAQIKNAAENSAADFIAGTSDSALNLVGAEASGTCVNMAGSSVNDSLNALDVGLPCTIGTSVGVRNLDTESYALTTKITLSHYIAPPIFSLLSNTRPLTGA